MTELISTNGYKFIVDDEDADEMFGGTWYAQLISGRRYIVSRLPKKIEYKRGYKYLLHRVLLGAMRGDVVDHINGNTLDNRRENLRIGTQSDNLCNRGKTNNNTSGLKGVSFSRDGERKKPWTAKIRKDNKTHYIGRFETKDQAARAYDKAAKELHGEFAKTND